MSLALFATAPAWSWQALTIGAAVFQTARNTSQRSLNSELGALGATYIRFLYGLPIALLWVALLVSSAGGIHIAAPGMFLAWCTFGGIIQVVGNACLLVAMKRRNFMLGIAYSKTEAIQAAIFGFIFLGEVVSWIALVAIVVATVGVMFISIRKRRIDDPAEMLPWYSSGAAIGLLCGACFGVGAVAYRAAALSTGAEAFEGAAYVLISVLSIQSAVLTVYIAFTQAALFRAMAPHWRLSLLSGTMGGLTSLCWFTAMALHTVADVRALGLSEMVFSYLASRRLYKEQIRPAEFLGMALICVGAVCLIYFR
jgi:drug/metabolite transporter (DMT)-like permease